MKEEIICAGFGGQGIMLLGKLIAYGGMNKGLYVSWMPSYGAEVRGGTAYSMVVLSDEEIASPIVSLCDTAIVMNTPSFDKYISHIKPNGIIIINSSMVNGKPDRKDIDILEVPMTETAHRLGNVRVANIVALGAYTKKKKIFSKDNIIDGIRKTFQNNERLVDINIKALEEGLKI